MDAIQLFLDFLRGNSPEVVWEAKRHRHMCWPHPCLRRSNFICSCYALRSSLTCIGWQHSSSHTSEFPLPRSCHVRPRGE
jgi:hypothetical protein